uniref:Uncharacterized protein n=1 Tax=Oryza glumipatula TaxID=40148 RepID=A0A0E0BDN3_9ORYZ
MVGGGDQARHAAGAHHRADAAVLPASLRHRLRGTVRPGRARRRRRDAQHPPPGPQRGVRRRQGELHPHRHGAHRPRAAPSSASRQHGRHDRLSPRARLGVRRVRRREGRRGGGRRRRRCGGGVRVRVLRRDRAVGVGVQLGDPAAAAARAGRQRRHRHEPRHVVTM